MILLILTAIVFGPAVILLFTPRHWLVPVFACLALFAALGWWTVFGHSCVDAVFAFMDEAIARTATWTSITVGVVRIGFEANRIEMEQELQPLFTSKKVAIATVPFVVSVCLISAMLIGGDPSCRAS